MLSLHVMAIPEVIEDLAEPSPTSQVDGIGGRGESLLHGIGDAHEDGAYPKALAHSRLEHCEEHRVVPR